MTQTITIAEATKDLKPFPTDVPIAPVPQVSLSKLQAGDATECKKVFEACKNEGFFHLDLTTSPDLGQPLLSCAEKLYPKASEFADMPLSTKFEYLINPQIDGHGSLSGWKPAMTDIRSQADNSGALLLKPGEHPDTTEWWNIDKDHLFGFVPSRPYPKEIMTPENTDIMKTFSENGHLVSMLVLDILGRELGIAPELLTKRHAFDQPSGDHVRLTYKPPMPEGKAATGLNAHHDIGSVTVLFNWLGGLQIQSIEPGREGEWEYVRPVPGHALINLGDAMVKYSDGILKSGFHRVIEAPGEQRKSTRISIVTFLKPCDESEMADLLHGENVERDESGKKLNAKEWTQRRYRETFAKIKEREGKAY